MQIEADSLAGLPPTSQFNTLQSLLARLPIPPSGLYSALLEDLQLPALSSKS
jgi:hypothetical protein